MEGMVLRICLSNGEVIEDPEKRIREYCEIEIYRGYDDCHNVTDEITWEDIKAANRLYAYIGRLEAEKLVNSREIPVILSRIDNVDLGDISDYEWLRVRSCLQELLRVCLAIRGVGLAKATKVLHLKRPKLIPILDSYVMSFLLNIDVRNFIPKDRLLKLGVQAIEIVRMDLINNREEFAILQRKLHDLPIPLEKVRLYDILCWTTEKWDIREELNAPYGKPSRSLRRFKKSEMFGEEQKALTYNEDMKFVRCYEIKTVEQFEMIRSKGEGFIVITDIANPNKIHRPNCRWVTRENFVEKVIRNKCRNGRYFWTNDFEYAKNRFKAQPCRTCKPDRLRCV